MIQCVNKEYVPGKCCMGYFDKENGQNTICMEPSVVRIRYIERLSVVTDLLESVSEECLYHLLACSGVLDIDEAIKVRESYHYPGLVSITVERMVEQGAL